MGESACLMQPFSYAAPQGDSLGALGQSVSFGRFMSEKLDWEKWSAFSTHNPYVAEAERYSKPGSVAQKKAFFEAHYKKLAAARKAAAEEALLLQQQIPKPQPVQEEDINGGGNKDWLVSKPDLETSGRSLDDSAEMKFLAGEEGVFRGNRQSDEKENCGLAESEINAKVSSTGGEHVDEEKPILMSSQKKSKNSQQSKSSTKSRVYKYNSSERTPSQKSSNKSSSYTFTPAKEFNRLVSIIRKIDGSRASSKPTKDCKTPLRTPSSNKVSAKGIADDSLSSPLSSNRSKCRGKIAPDSSAKTGRGRWNFLPAETPSCFTPFGLRTEERAERRKKKLEEKFKAMEPQNQKAEERSVEKEESKLRQRLCFKAKPLPNFYKQRPKSTDQTKKALLQ
ncbi:protein WVD2-like 7 isoform X2 [Arabidopsis lyrata subsp. lyrata]|uniref:protein WVD2-like 7 isoform X2 n=1 Tax=Arabidopsis lyrata subsp. lyrata TaxID=81972 RepID=UPI000A29D805|nr:protein WVD2-like 7 isoform X2 [Arabidopsis lyrata subsp. lyrata]|eukprot:XP_020885947.1 protein WVD2-like 7 isoform X2 [Arabidopsis lyrata subsp. lyrata]